MTLKEALKHAQEKAKTQEDPCGQEHRQLAEWLEELLELRGRFSSHAKNDPNSAEGGISINCPIGEPTLPQIQAPQQNTPYEVRIFHLPVYKENTEIFLLGDEEERLLTLNEPPAIKEDPLHQALQQAAQIQALQQALQQAAQIQALQQALQQAAQIQNPPGRILMLTVPGNRATALFIPGMDSAHALRPTLRVYNKETNQAYTITGDTLG